jgi:hypothetical protein
MSFRFTRGKFIAAAVFVVASVALSSPGMAATHGTVYLMRGLANVFSLGLDTLNDKLHAKGIDSIVTGYSGWQGIANKIEASYAKNKAATTPIVIIGHSFGADAAVYLSNQLNSKKIPVALVVTFDVVTDVKVSPNVRHVVNFYTNGFGHLLKGAAGFKGRIENIDATRGHPDIGHLNIEKSPRLHARTIREIQRLM